MIEAYCNECKVTFNPTGEEDNDPPEHGLKPDETPCGSTDTEVLGTWLPSAR